MAVGKQCTSVGHLSGHDSRRDPSPEKCFTQGLTGKRIEYLYYLHTTYEDIGTNVSVKLCTYIVKKIICGLDLVSI